MLWERLLFLPRVHLYRLIVGFTIVFVIKDSFQLNLNTQCFLRNKYRDGLSSSWFVRCVAHICVGGGSSCVRLGKSTVPLWQLHLHLHLYRQSCHLWTQRTQSCHPGPGFLLANVVLFHFADINRTECVLKVRLGSQNLSWMLSQLTNILLVLGDTRDDSKSVRGETHTVFFQFAVAKVVHLVLDFYTTIFINSDTQTDRTDHI